MHTCSMLRWNCVCTTMASTARIDSPNAMSWQLGWLWNHLIAVVFILATNVRTYVQLASVTDWLTALPPSYFLFFLHTTSVVNKNDVVVGVHCVARCRFSLLRHLALSLRSSRSLLFARLFRSSSVFCCVSFFSQFFSFYFSHSLFAAATLCECVCIFWYFDFAFACATLTNIYILIIWIRVEYVFGWLCACTCVFVVAI